MTEIGLTSQFGLLKSSHVFLAMLALLESRILLRSASGVKDFRLVMMLYMHPGLSPRASNGLLKKSRKMGRWV